MWGEHLLGADPRATAPGHQQRGAWHPACAGCWPWPGDSPHCSAQFWKLSSLETISASTGIFHAACQGGRAARSSKPMCVFSLWAAVLTGAQPSSPGSWAFVVHHPQPPSIPLRALQVPQVPCSAAEQPGAAPAACSALLAGKEQQEGELLSLGICSR